MCLGKAANQSVKMQKRVVELKTKKRDKKRKEMDKKRGSPFYLYIYTGRHGVYDGLMQGRNQWFVGSGKWLKVLLLLLVHLV